MGGRGEGEIRRIQCEKWESSGRLEKKLCLPGAGMWGTPGVGTKNTWGDRVTEETEEDSGAVLEPSPRGLESEGKGLGSRGKATRRAGLPGSRGTRREDATGPRVPSSRRPGPRGAGNRERPRPEGPVTRCCPNRTHPAAPPSSLLLPSLHPAARYPAAAALTSGT